MHLNGSPNLCRTIVIALNLFISQQTTLLFLRPRTSQTLYDIEYYYFKLLIIVVDDHTPEHVQPIEASHENLMLLANIKSQQRDAQTESYQFDVADFILSTSSDRHGLIAPMSWLSQSRYILRTSSTHEQHILSPLRRQQLDVVCLSKKPHMNELLLFGRFINCDASHSHVCGLLRTYEYNITYHLCRRCDVMMFGCLRSIQCGFQCGMGKCLSSYYKVESREHTSFYEYVTYRHCVCERTRVMFIFVKVVHM